MINSRHRRSLIAGLGFALTVSMLTSCAGSTDRSASAPTSAAPNTTIATPATSESPKGWVDGEPSWSASEDAVSKAAAVETADIESMARDPEAEVVATEAAAADGADEFAVAPAERSSASLYAPEAPIKQNVTPLRAGSRDDNADFEAYREYRRNFPTYEVPVRDLSVEGRTLITVATEANLPCAGCVVAVKQGERDLGTVRTTADGSARIHPVAFGGNATDQLTLSVGAQTITVAPGTTASITAGSATAGAPLDVMFLLDATGSMDDEIDRLKTSIDDVAAQISALEGARGLRLGMTVFRDEGDAFVTSTFDFTSNVADFRAALAKVAADGGGDTPEAVDEALADALDKPTWRPSGEATQLIFLVGDAGPQVQRQVRKTYVDSAKEAATRGIKIIPIASSNTDDLAEYVFRQVAQFTGGRFVFMSYGAEGNGAAVGGSTNIDTTSIDELPLDRLIVKLVSDEVAARRGNSAGPVQSGAQSGGPSTTTTIDQQRQ
jgi:hypothetical protein